MDPSHPFFPLLLHAYSILVGQIIIELHLKSMSAWHQIYFSTCSIKLLEHNDLNTKTKPLLYALLAVNQIFKELLQKFII